MQLAAQEIAQTVRTKVADLNEALAMAANLEGDVEIAVGTDENGNARDLKVWCSQEV